MRCQHKLFVAAKLRRADATRVAVKLEEAYDRADAHATLLGGVGYGSAIINCLDHASTQVLRIWFRHACRPPPSRKLESYSRWHGNPPDSAFSGNALVRHRALFNLGTVNPNSGTDERCDPLAGRSCRPLLERDGIHFSGSCSQRGRAAALATTLVANLSIADCAAI